MIFHNIRYGLPMLAKTPGVTFFAILALAFGIGANTAIFSVVHAVLLRPLPYKDTDHLLELALVFEQGGPRGSPLSPSDVFDFRAHNRSFEFAAFSDDIFNYSSGETPEQIAGAWTTAGFFSVVRQGLRLTLIGVAFGLVGAFAITRVITNLLFGVSAADLATFIGVSLFLILVSLASCYLPARRASKVNPVEALAHT